MLAVQLVIGALFFVFGVSLGILLRWFRLPGWMRDTVEGSLSFARCNTAGNDRRIEMPFTVLEGKNVMVAVVFGQSNSCNSGETRHISGQGVYNYYMGRLYKASDPLLGGGEVAAAYGRGWET